mgnify:CR=1 FL=1
MEALTSTETTSAPLEAIALAAPRPCSSEPAASGGSRELLALAAPLIVSHANACGMLDNPRNLADDQIKAIADQGGLVGILALPERVAKKEATIDDLLKHKETELLEV